MQFRVIMVTYPRLSASAVVIHYEEALYQVYAPLPLHRPSATDRGDYNKLRRSLARSVIKQLETEKMDEVKETKKRQFNW